jgi:hypothetical protein
MRSKFCHHCPARRWSGPNPPEPRTSLATSGRCVIVGPGGSQAPGRYPTAAPSNVGAKGEPDSATGVNPRLRAEAAPRRINADVLTNTV